MHFDLIKDMRLAEDLFERMHAERDLVQEVLQIRRWSMRAHPQTSWCRMPAAPGASRDLPKPVANTAFGGSIGSTIEWPKGGSPRTELPCG